MSLFNISNAALTFWYTSLRASDCEKALLACLKIIAVISIIIAARDMETTSSTRVKAERLLIDARPGLPKRRLGLGRGAIPARLACGRPAVWARDC